MFLVCFNRTTNEQIRGIITNLPRNPFNVQTNNKIHYIKTALKERHLIGAYPRPLVNVTKEISPSKANQIEPEKTCSEN